MNRIIELPNTEVSTKHRYLLPEGKYWFGDLLCVMDIHTEWKQLLEIVDAAHREGLFEFPDGRQFAIWSSYHGEGEYWDNDGATWYTESGYYGIIRLDSLNNPTQYQLSMGYIFDIITPTEMSNHMWRFELGDFNIDFDENFGGTDEEDDEEE